MAAGKPEPLCVPVRHSTRAKANELGDTCDMLGEMTHLCYFKGGASTKVLRGAVRQPRPH